MLVLPPDGPEPGPALAPSAESSLLPAAQAAAIAGANPRNIYLFNVPRPSAKQGAGQRPVRAQFSRNCVQAVASDTDNAVAVVPGRARPALQTLGTDPLFRDPSRPGGPSW